MLKDRTEFLIITTYIDAKRFYTIHKMFIEELAKTIKNFKIVFVDNLLLFNKKKKINLKKLEYYPPNTKFLFLNNTDEFFSKLKGKKYVAFTNLNKYLHYFKVHYLIKKKNIRQISLMNMGLIPDNNNYLNLKFWNYINDFLNRKIVFTVFKLLTLINVFQRVDIRFISNLSYKKFSKKSIVGKLNKIFKTRKFDYYDKYIKVNARIYDRVAKEKNLKISNKYITFVDTNLEHETKIEYEGRFSKKRIKEYYYRLNRYLKNLENTFKKKVIVCAHPNPNYKLSESKSFFKKFKVVKFKTDYYVRNAFIYVALSSSVTVDAIFFKKRIICLDSELMGKHHNDANKNYPRAAGVFLQNFDNDLKIDKKILIENLDKRIKTYNKYIKKKIVVDGNNIGVEKVCKILKKKYSII